MEAFCNSTSRENCVLLGYYATSSNKSNAVTDVRCVRLVTCINMWPYNKGVITDYLHNCNILSSALY